MQDFIRFLAALILVHSIIYSSYGLTISTTGGLEDRGYERQEQQDEEGRLLPSSPQRHDLASSKFQAVDIQPRVDNSFIVLYDDWTFTLQDLGVFLPVATASSALWQLYDTVIDRAQQLELAGEPPLHIIEFVLGALDLKFYNTTEVIPWSFVISFAQLMRIRARLGMVCRYKAYLTDMLTGSTVLVRLGFRIPPAVGWRSGYGRPGVG